MQKLEMELFALEVNFSRTAKQALLGSREVLLGSCSCQQLGRISHLVASNK